MRENPAAGTKVSAFLIAYQAPPVPHDHNIYWQELERRLGISLDMMLVPAASYPEKISALSASGAYADLTFLELISAPNQYKVVVQGAYTDLTPYLTAEALAEYPNLAHFPESIWKSASLNGTLYGVPRPRALASNTLLFRQDWAEIVGIPQARNADQFADLMVAFTVADPDANGKADTYGMGAKSSGAAIFNLEFFADMFRTPNNWRLNHDGSLTNEIETEEFNAAIVYLRRLADAGIFHPDTATMTTSQAQDAFIRGAIGALMDSTQIAAGRQGIRGRTRELNPRAEPIGLMPMAFDGANAVTRIADGTFGFIAIPTKVGKTPKRVRELLRVLDYYAAPFGSEEWTFLQFGIEGRHHTIADDGTHVLTAVGKAEIGELNRLTNGLPTYYYPDAPGDAQRMQNLVRNLLAIGSADPTRGLYSPTHVAKVAELNQLRIDRLTAIIVGRDPLSALAAYIAEWHNRGGNQIRSEYERAINAQ